MKATEANFLSFLKAPKQFIIPIYQRPYSWSRKECEQLWNDIVRVAENDVMPGHFVGSIVYIERDVYQISGVPQLLVIDGQQRLTTLSLLLAALSRVMSARGIEGEISATKIDNYYLFNSFEDGELRYKLLLTRGDRETLTRLLDGKELHQPSSARIADNSRFFEEQIGRSNIDPLLLYRGIAKLIIVDIALSRDHDNPQLIFESLNSTGLDLTEADLIRNYVLMGQLPKEQNSLYDDYWYPMERSFGQTGYAEQFNRFMRDYLTMKTRTIPNIRAVYEAFKVFARGAGGSIREIVADIHRFARYFVRMALEREDDRELLRIFRDINTVKVDVAYPLLLEVYDDYESGLLRREEFVEILRLVESYVFRRAVCGIPANVLNKTFASLGKELDKSRYLESFKALLALKGAGQRFPDDGEFRRELMLKDVYNFRHRNYLLGKLENRDRKEPVAVDEYTIEHIMPQNPELSPAWREELGSSWREVQARNLHTLGNLTLTGYNAEMSDRPFAEKRDMEKGFRYSPIRLNQDLVKLERWTEEQMRERGSRLTSLAAAIWPYPALPEEALARYRVVEKRGFGQTYTLADHPSLSGPMLELFEALRRRILNLDASVREEVKKLYIAFKADTNFVDVEPQRKRLRLTLNMPFVEIDDPKLLCNDISNIGRWGNGEVEVALYSPEQVDDVMDLIRQAFAWQMEVEHE